MAEISPQMFDRHVAIVGQRQAIKNLNFAAKLAKTKKAITSDAGREILKNVESKIDTLNYIVIMDDAATIEQRMELRALVKIYIDWVERISKFEEVTAKIKG